MMPLPGLGLPDAPPRTEGDPRTRDRARTAERRRKIAAGVHPLRGEPTRPELGTCGTCAHLIRTGGVRSFLKCNLGPVTRGPGSDLRRWWPACPRYAAPSVPPPTKEPR